MIVVIDGPAGSGKSSTARAVADKLGIEYLDSGALYRALTVVYLKANSDSKVFFELLDETDISFNYKDGMFHVGIDGLDVTDKLRSAKVSDNVSQVASMPEVRTYINSLMNEAVHHGQYIAEGRDLGTAVFPEADLKFYMLADMDERARRRFKELQEQDIEISLEDVRDNIQKRDHKDTQRKADPLRKAEDAIEIDTTNVSFEQQVNSICSKVSEMMKVKNLNNNH